MPSVDTPAHQFSDRLADTIADTITNPLVGAFAHAFTYAIAYTVGYTFAIAYAITHGDAWIGGRRSGSPGRFLVTARFRHGWHPLLH